MRLLCVVAVVIASIAGCASTPGTESRYASSKERAEDTYLPTGTIIPRKKSERGTAGVSPVAEVDKQALDNERAMSTRQ